MGRSDSLVTKRKQERHHLATHVIVRDADEGPTPFAVTHGRPRWGRAASLTILDDRQPFKVQL
jgi:hypothetical protein